MRSRETRAVTIWLGDDGIIRFDVKRGLESFDVHDARESIAAQASLCDGRRRPVLIDLGDMQSLSRECRHYYAGPEPAKVQSACAMLVRSPVARAIGNFFMGINKTAVEARLFTSEPEAIAWLKEFVT
jgi:hypothetical protein